jgi:predicted phosphodiesterase
MLSFIHLSDIHFGQEVGGALVTHEDVRERLVDDVAEFFSERRASGRPATGVLITGDIAYSGREDEYVAAGLWLDRVCSAAGCEATSIQVVPGNHDVDLRKITAGAHLMLSSIVEKGESHLDQMLTAERDRALLHARLEEYERFASGYGCSVDDGGGHCGEKQFELAANRRVAFVGLNSALLCRGGDDRGKLILGQRQRTIALEPGVERIVLMHHPPHWLADISAVKAYIRNRARILLWGHEHAPDIEHIVVDQGAGFLAIASGATTPPYGYGYSYSVIDLTWVEDGDALRADIYARVWGEATRFISDRNRMGGNESRSYVLECPQFRSAGPPPPIDTCRQQPSDAANEAPMPTYPPDRASGDAHDVRFGKLRLLFFRDLTKLQRLNILTRLGTLPAGLAEFLSMSTERSVLGQLNTPESLDLLEEAIQQALCGEADSRNNK